MPGHNDEILNPGGRVKFPIRAVSVEK